MYENARRFSAPIISLLFSGGGHFAIGRWRRGLVWLFVCDLFFSIYFKLVLERVFLPMWLLVLVGWGLRIASAIDVARIRRSAAEVPRVGVVILTLLGLSTLTVSEALWLRANRIESFKIPSGGMIPTLQIK